MIAGLIGPTASIVTRHSSPTDGGSSTLSVTVRMPGDSGGNEVESSSSQGGCLFNIIHVFRLMAGYAQPAAHAARRAFRAYRLPQPGSTLHRSGGQPMD